MGLVDTDLNYDRKLGVAEKKSDDKFRGKLVCTVIKNPSRIGSCQTDSDFEISDQDSRS